LSGGAGSIDTHSLDRTTEAAMHVRFSILVLLASLLPSTALPGADGPRRVISLDGRWQIAEGKMEPAPTAFERKAPVPGLVSLAEPPFVEPGPKVADRKRFSQKDPRRDAFWYRRTFRLDGPVPAVATLLVRKAMFGARVILNGRPLGDHFPSFTPGHFPAGAALREGENEVLIRVGADRDAVGPAIPSGFDFEKDRYIPGIFDSVELVLSGTPHFLDVQAAPDLAGKAVRVRARLENAGDPTAARLSFTVREARSGKEAGRLTTEPVSLARGEEKVVDVRIPLADVRRWSPDDPFLYILEAESGADSFRTRFGMRELRFDPASGHAILNGKPFFLRGSNITLYRFFEDAECKARPWDGEWVRRLHERVKEMHWNCLRYCIGFPPEAWYDIADELGILIQDEFPLWHGAPGWDVYNWPRELGRGELAREYAEWMRERWNHPCVMIWDANNETASPETSPAIQAVRALDLSARPWDNSYSPPLEPGDVLESHPYQFNAGFRLRDLARASPIPQGNPVPNDGRRGVVINEYGWHWLNRDGTPTTLTRDIYKSVLGEDASPERRFHMQATWLAAATEFWRSGRKAAAVMHFTTLGYSRPDGQTSDHWKDVERLEWEPEFRRYVRDAFAPIGLMLDFRNMAPIQGTSSRVEVALIDDLDAPWNGPVTLRVRRGDRALAELRQEGRLEPFGRTELAFEVRWPAESGPCVLEAEIQGAGGEPVKSVRDIEVVDPRSMGFAFQRKVTASSMHSAEYKPENAVDGDPATYWSSEFTDPAWLEVDLGEKRRIERVRIEWENAFAKSFSVRVGSDGDGWTEVHRTDDGKGGVTEVRFAAVDARKVRLECARRATRWGNAVRELSVFGAGEAAAIAPAAAPSPPRGEPAVHPALAPLPPGAVEPEGWLRDWALAARDGITGHLDEWHPTFGGGWKGQPIRAPGAHPDGTGWPIEQSSYWLDGLVRLGYLLHDDGLIAKARERLGLVVAGVLGGGPSFIYWRPKEVLQDGFNKWAHSHMGRALVALHAASGDPRVLEALVRAYRDFELPDLSFGGLNGVENLDALLETYARSGDRRLLEPALALSRRPSFQATIEKWLRSEFDCQHGVCALESARLPALLYPWTGEKKHLDATLKALEWLDGHHLLPCGVISSEEFISGIGAFRAIESCNVPCTVWDYVWLLRLLGDGRYGDRVEQAFFNAGPAPIARDFKTACYYQSPNRISASLPGDEPRRSPGKGGFTFTPLACPQVLCCVGNLNRLLPNYIMHMWMATPDGGLAATLHGPSRVRAKVGDGVPVTLTCSTAYPFEEEIRIAVSPERPCAFPLYFRRPGWCANPSVTAGGAPVEPLVERNGFIRLERKWSSGDTVVLRFPMKVRIPAGRETPYPRADYFKEEGRAASRIEAMDNPYLTVFHGPLLFALPIPDRDPNTPAEGARWNYALDALASEVEVERRPMPGEWRWQLEAPVVLRARARSFDWQPTDARPLPAAPVDGGEAAAITLVPYGCTKFRVSMFPVTRRAWEGAGPADR
jgi:F5/8 type C domain-containing protein/glycosyl hydrolase family 127 (putative beta-L-arabinofuranosidase)/glycosyl hydrolase family 2/beta-L-arabinofuranosidase (glycosyl hydrolase family 127)